MVTKTEDGSQVKLAFSAPQQLWQEFGPRLQMKKKGWNLKMQELLYRSYSDVKAAVLALTAKWQRLGGIYNGVSLQLLHQPSDSMRILQGCLHVVAMASDAFHILEAALEQMDDIIAGKSY